MTNEEKAREIANDDTLYGEDPDNNSKTDECYIAALAMAQWKDEQLDSAIDKALQRNGDFLKQGKITQYGYDIAFATIKNIREYLKNKQDEHNKPNTTKTD